MKKKLTKSQKNRMISGVCGGIGEYFKVDATIVRLIFVAFALFKGAGLLLYIIAAVVIPSADFDDETIENMKSANFDENECNDSSSESGSEDVGKGKNKKESSIHTNEEFDSFFKK